MREWDDDGYPVLEEDEEVVPVAPPPPSEPKVAHSTRWVLIGYPQDGNFQKGRRRVNALKKVRKKKRVNIQKIVSLSQPLVDASEKIMERYDVAFSVVCRKFFEEGIRKLAQDQNWPEVSEIAGLVRKEPNPFDAMAATPSTYEYSQTPSWQNNHMMAGMYANAADMMLPSSVGPSLPTSRDDQSEP